MSKQGAIDILNRGFSAIRQRQAEGRKRTEKREDRSYKEKENEKKIIRDLAVKIPEVYMKVYKAAGGTRQQKQQAAQEYVNTMLNGLRQSGLNLPEMDLSNLITSNEIIFQGKDGNQYSFNPNHTAKTGEVKTKKLGPAQAGALQIGQGGPQQPLETPAQAASIGGLLQSNPNAAQAEGLLQSEPTAARLGGLVPGGSAPVQSQGQGLGAMPRQQGTGTFESGSLYGDAELKKERISRKNNNEAAFALMDKLEKEGKSNEEIIRALSILSGKSSSLSRVEVAKLRKSAIKLQADSNEFIKVFGKGPTKPKNIEKQIKEVDNLIGQMIRTKEDMDNSNVKWSDIKMKHYNMNLKKLNKIKQKLMDKQRSNLSGLPGIKRNASQPKRRFKRKKFESLLSGSISGVTK